MFFFDVCIYQLMFLSNSTFSHSSTYEYFVPSVVIFVSFCISIFCTYMYQVKFKIWSSSFDHGLGLYKNNLNSAHEVYIFIVKDKVFTTALKNKHNGT